MQLKRYDTQCCSRYNLRSTMSKTSLKSCNTERDIQCHISLSSQNMGMHTCLSCYFLCTPFTVLGSRHQKDCFLLNDEAIFSLHFDDFLHRTFIMNERNDCITQTVLKQNQITPKKSHKNNNKNKNNTQPKYKMKSKKH